MSYPLYTVNGGSAANEYYSDQPPPYRTNPPTIVTQLQPIFQPVPEAKRSHTATVINTKTNNERLETKEHIGDRGICWGLGVGTLVGVAILVAGIALAIFTPPLALFFALLTPFSAVAFGALSGVATNAIYDSAHGI